MQNKKIISLFIAFVLIVTALLPVDYESFASVTTTQEDVPGVNSMDTLLTILNLIQRLQTVHILFRVLFQACHTISKPNILQPRKLCALKLYARLIIILL